MIYDEDPFRRRSRKSPARQKRWEKCVWLVENWAEWASGHGQLTKIGLSDSCGGETITTRCNFGMIAMNLEVIWEMSDKWSEVTASGSVHSSPIRHCRLSWGSV